MRAALAEMPSAMPPCQPARGHPALPELRLVERAIEDLRHVGQRLPLTAGLPEDVAGAGGAGDVQPGDLCPGRVVDDEVGPGAGSIRLDLHRMAAGEGPPAHRIVGVGLDRVAECRVQPRLLPETEEVAEDPEPSGGVAVVHRAQRRVERVANQDLASRHHVAVDLVRDGYDVPAGDRGDARPGDVWSGQAAGLRRGGPLDEALHRLVSRRPLEGGRDAPCVQLVRRSPSGRCGRPTPARRPVPRRLDARAVRSSVGQGADRHSSGSRAGGTGLLHSHEPVAGFSRCFGRLASRRSPRPGDRSWP